MKIIEQLQKQNESKMGCSSVVEDDTIYSTLSFDVILQILEFHIVDLQTHFHKMLNDDESLNAEFLTKFYFGFQNSDQHRQKSLLFPCVKNYRNFNLEFRENHDILRTPIHIYPIETQFIQSNDAISLTKERLPTSLTGLDIHSIDPHCLSLVPNLKRLAIKFVSMHSRKETIEVIQKLDNLVSFSGQVTHEEILSNSNLTRLMLTGEKPSDEWVKKVFSLPKLRELDISETTYVVPLVDSITLPRTLRKLTIESFKVLNSAAECNMKHNLTSLEVTNAEDLMGLLYFLKDNTTLT
jgi:hypothetical protein